MVDTIPRLAISVVWYLTFQVQHLFQFSIRYGRSHGLSDELSILIHSKFALFNIYGLLRVKQLLFRMFKFKIRFGCHIGTNVLNFTPIG